MIRGMEEYRNQTQDPQFQRILNPRLSQTLSKSNLKEKETNYKWGSEF